MKTNDRNVLKPGTIVVNDTFFKHTDFIQKVKVRGYSIIISNSLHIGLCGTDAVHFVHTYVIEGDCCPRSKIKPECGGI